MIAEQLAPVSYRAYVGHFTPPDQTNTGTMGLVALCPAYAAWSQISESVFPSGFSLCITV